MVKIKWTDNALHDLKSIFDYIAKDSQRYANIQVKKIKDRTNVLKNQPHAGKIVPEFNDEKIRELIEGYYRIIYLVQNEEIFILTVHHSARLLK